MHHLAQINIGRMVAPAGDPAVAGSSPNLNRLNKVADAAPGFVWRLQDDGGNATAIQVVPDPRFIINMSTWTSAEALFDYVYRSTHTPVMGRRRGWFERLPGHHMALWWVPAGHVPGIDEGLSRLWRLDTHGPSPAAFTFKTRFPAPGLGGRPVDMQPDPWCMAWV